MSLIKKLKVEAAKIGLPKDITIAFSGGSDSSFLLDILHKAGYNIELAYYNHNLRSDSQEEEDLVKRKAEEYGVELFIERGNVREYAKKNRLGIEEAARKLRYEFFENFKAIATAHHQDDNIETIIFRMVRGTSLRGFKGIPSRRDNIFRPIISFTKKEIDQYLREHDIEYIKDKSNFDSTFTRNKIRNKVIPLLEEINPKFREKFINLVKDFKELKREEIFSDISSIKGVKRSHFEILSKDKNISIDLPGDKKVIKRYGKVKVIDKDVVIEDRLKALLLGETTTFNGYEIKAEKTKEKPYFNDKNVFFIKDIAPLYIRTREPGDFLIPFGSSHRKKLKNYFIDNKILREIRAIIPIVCFDNNIVWLPGEIGSAHFAETLESNNIKLTLISKPTNYDDLA